MTLIGLIERNTRLTEIPEQEASRCQGQQSTQGGTQNERPPTFPFTWQVAWTDTDVVKLKVDPADKLCQCVQSKSVSLSMKTQEIRKVNHLV